MSSNRLHQLAQPYLYPALLVGLLVLASWYIGVGKQIAVAPYGIHAWRTTDGASQALAYYHDGMNFFQPKLYNLGQGDGGRAVSEAPIVPYLTAITFHIFGPKHILFRLWSLLFVFAGLLALRSLTYNLTRNHFLALFIPLLVFSSPFFVFYANNLMPNILAVSFIFIGYWFLERYHRHHRLFDFAFMVGALTLAALVKQPLIAVFGVLILLAIGEWLGWYSLSADAKPVLSKRPLPQLLIAGLSLAIFIGWLAFAKHYNQVYHSSGFLLSSNGLAGATKEQVTDTLYNILTYWSNDYFTAIGWLFVVVSAWFALMFLPGIAARVNVYRPFMALSWIGYFVLLAFFFLWFRQYKYHDYYVLDVFAFLVPQLIILAAYFSEKHAELLTKGSFKAALAFCLLISFWLCKGTYADRYNEGDAGKKSAPAIQNASRASLQETLNAIGLTTDQKVIVVPGQSPELLYAMDRRGWTELSYRPDDTLFLANYSAQGASFLVLIDTAFVKDPALSGRLPAPLLELPQEGRSPVQFYKLSGK